MSGGKPLTSYGKAGPGADLRMFMEKRLVVTLNLKRKVLGQLRGYDMFMNIVLDNAVEVIRPEVVRKLGTIIIRGNAILTWECVDKSRESHECSNAIVKCHMGWPQQQFFFEANCRPPDREPIMDTGCANTMRVKAVVIRSANDEVIYRRLFNCSQESTWGGPSVSGMRAMCKLTKTSEGLVADGLWNGVGYAVKFDFESDENEVSIQPLKATFIVQRLAEVYGACIELPMDLPAKRLVAAGVVELMFDGAGKPSPEINCDIVRALLPSKFGSNETLLDVIKEKVTSVASGPEGRLGQGSGSGVGGGGLLDCGSDIWWRRSGCHYAQNELLIDVIEAINCVINRKGSVVSSSLSSEIVVQARLSGLPECRVVLEGRDRILSKGFHQCCKRKHSMARRRGVIKGPDGGFDQTGIIQFVPPDGTTRIMRFTPVSEGSRWRPPVTFNCTWNYNPDRTGKIDIVFQVDSGSAGFTNRLNSRTLSNDWILDDVQLRIPLGPIPRVEPSVSLGACVYQSELGVVLWELGELSASTPTSKMEIHLDWKPETAESVSTKTKWIGDSIYGTRLRGLMNFRCARRNLSGVYVTMVSISESPNLYKGCRHAVVSGIVQFEF